MKTKVIARFGLLTALALVLGYAEQWIPVAPGIPGIKLGLANTVLLYAVYMASPLEAAMLMVSKVLLSGFLYAGFAAMLYSLAGGILSLIVMLLLCRLPRVGVIGVSAAGAVAHNIGQLAVAAAMLGVGTVWAYLPILMLSGVVMGPVTGYVAKSVFAALKRTGTEFRVVPKPFRATRFADILLITGMLAAAGVFWAGMATSGLDLGSAKAAVDEANAPAYYVEVTQNGEVTYVIPLSDQGTYTLENPYTDGYNTFVIDGDGVHVSDASCPDHICISEGTIGPGDTLPICCLPNLLILQIITGDELPEGFDLASQNLGALKSPD
jgi:heptaprenyl diphosphate synthase